MAAASDPGARTDGAPATADAAPDVEDDDFDDESPPYRRRAPRPAPARRRSPWLRAVVVLVAVVAVALVLAGLWRAAPERNLQVPTTGRAASAHPSPLQGAVLAARTGRRVCFWIDGPNGRAFVVVPKGWTADSDLRLLDPLGRVRLIGGDPALLMGTAGRRQRVTGCPGLGRPWYTSDVLPARGADDDRTLPPR